MKITEFIKKEAVLCAAIFLAVISMFFVPPDKGYISYIDWRTLGLLLCLMLIVAGLSASGVFTYTANAMLKRINTVRGLIFTLVFLCFFFSMLITNDVALITFVPFGIIVLKTANCEKYIIRTTVFQTLAANAGSMFTPIGNPQNLYLYGISNMKLSEHLLLMLPYTLFSGILLVLLILSVKKENIGDFSQTESPDKRSVIFYCILFAISLLSVAKILDWRILLLIVCIFVAVKDKNIFKKADYSLLATFIGFFVFIGNMGRITFFKELIESVVSGNEVLSAILSSQVISNVPAALLLSGFTGDTKALIIGTNIGGFGTLIASMASLISFKNIDNSLGKGRYMAVFTACNLLFVAALSTLYFILNL